jgi:hypothetical protein
MKINNIFLFFFFFSIILLGISLNFFFKSPNDGVLYYQAAEHLLKSGTLINPTSIFPYDIFPTTQIGIVFFISFLIFIFKKIWIFMYAITISVIWVVLFRRLRNFSEKQFQIKLIFFLLLFFNYDHLVALTSFYNEALYYPFLIFSFLKIINSIEKKKDIFNKSFFLSFFLVFGVAFRLQHLVLLISLFLYFLIQKNFKNLFLIFIIIILSGLLLYLSNFFIFNYHDYLYLNINEKKSFLKQLIDLQYLIDGDLILKNLKVNLSLFLHFTNIPKIIDFTIPNNFKSIKELLYLIIALVLFILVILGIRVNKNTKTTLFLLLYLIFTFFFLLLFADLATRYFLLSNFFIIFFIFKYIYSYNKKILRLNIFIIPSIAITSFLLCVFYYFTNSSAQVKNTYSLNMIIKEFSDNRDGSYAKNEVYITDTYYVFSWWNRKPAIHLRYFFDNKFFENAVKKNNIYYYFGSKINFLDSYNHFYNSHQTSISLYKMEDFTYSKDTNTNKDVRVWRVYFK